jgi:DNA topoisomerase II
MAAISDNDLDDLLGGFGVSDVNALIAYADTVAATAVSTAPAPEAGDEFTLSDVKDHAKKKAMWAGALTPINIPDLLGAVPAVAEDDDDEKEPEAAARRPDALVVAITRAHTPALLKAMDEIIVNATDAAKEHEKLAASKRVTEIKITYDRATGRVTVFNNGPGIPVILHAEATRRAGTNIYVVTVAFSYFLAGTNIDKDLSNVKGGINGLGAKLCNVHSLEFTVDTTDGVTRNHFRQQWRDRLDVVEPPTVTNLRKAHNLPESETVPHTRVSFIPAYEALGYKMKDGQLSAADADDIDAYLRLRAHQVAAYLGSKVAVSYNDEHCGTTSAALLGRLLLTPLGDESSDALVMSTMAKSTVVPFKSHPWNIAVVILPPGRKAGRRAAAQNMTIVNGVLSNKGSHVKYIKDMLSTAVEDKLRKATKRGAKATGRMSVTETLGGVRLVMCGAIPGADWGGQRKDELQVSKETLSNYSMTAAFLKQVGDAIAERILISQGAKSGKFVHDKYTKAKHAGKTKKSDTNLLAAEGDSAITLLRAGLTQTRKAQPPGGPSLDWNGIISLQGVIVNAAREVSSMETTGGDVINVRSAKLQSNKRLLALADAYGLRYDRTYVTAKERATLNYGRLLLCVDQDLDGTGKIAALVLVWINLFWPALLRNRCIGRFMTPLVRVKPKRAGGVLHEFYYEEELTHWLEANPDWQRTHQAPKYYKGLATHDADEVKKMFTPEAFARSIYMYTLDDAAAARFEVYFGANPALRKEVLVTPVTHLTFEAAQQLHAAQSIPIGRVQLDVDTKSYKNDAIKRQIPGAVDGLNPARRKIIMGAILRFIRETSTKELKVFQLAGFVADKLFYHHGDMSLNATIVYLAQMFAGARRYPYLIGVGQFGSRHGDKAGSARYISVKLSPFISAVFPAADRWHLTYVREDGQRAEPEYFVPVVPMAALESYKIVSEGWNHDGYGRDEAAVLAVVRAYIAGDNGLLELSDRLHELGPTEAVLADVATMAAGAWALPASTRGYTGEVRNYRGEAYSFGSYTWAETTRTVTVTELPMGLATTKYIETLTKPGVKGKPNARDVYIESVDDRSSADSVELVIRLRDGAYEQIAEKFGDPAIDPIEDALMLRSSLRPHLNYYAANGGVLEFGEQYLASVLYWAPLRRDLYSVRVERQRIVAELRILEEEEIIRYIGIAGELDLASIADDDAASAVLHEHKFPTLDCTLLHKPEYTLNADLHRLVTSGPCVSHNYLLDLRERDLVRAAVLRRENVLVGLRANRAHAIALLAERPVPCASLWLEEISEFERVVQRGSETNWKFK